MLTPSNTIGSFYKRGLYRACLVKANDVFRLYFSADDGYKTYMMEFSKYPVFTADEEKKAFALLSETKKSLEIFLLGHCSAQCNSQSAFEFFQHQNEEQGRCMRLPHNRSCR